MNKFPKKRKKAPPITEEMAGGFRINTDGWSLMLERGFIKSYHKRTNFIWMDLSEKKHPREYKRDNKAFNQIFPNEVPNIPYRFGKVNNFYQLKIGYGQKRQLSGKLDKKNVTIHWTYGAGLALGFTKPYYIEILEKESNGALIRKSVSYNDEKYESYFTTDKEVTLQNKQGQDIGFTNAVVGGTFFTQGIGQMKIKPGLSGRTGFYFDFAPSKKTFMGVEIGASLELYPSEIEIIANAENRATFLNLYLDLRFGKRRSRY